MMPYGIKPCSFWIKAVLKIGELNLSSLISSESLFGERHAFPALSEKSSSTLSTRIFFSKSDIV